VIERIIQAEAPGFWAYLNKVWTYRRLIGVFALRDLQAQYAQTALGILWAVIKPLIALGIFSLFFGVLVPLDDKIGSPYPLFAFSGMIAWYFFTYIVTQAGTAVVNAQQLISRIYFPKLILPLSRVLTGMVDLGISLVLLMVMMVAWGHWPGPQLLLLPLFVLMGAIVGMSIAIWLAAMTSRYRDFHHLLPYLVNFLIWLTPVFYPTTLIPAEYAHWIYLNPMAGVIAGFRWALLGDAAPPVMAWLGFVPVVILLAAGLWYFERVERNLVDSV
jgi:lipopolysaccharide transport system permease protein